MNKEYSYISDKELLVVDTKGRAIKRNVESPNMHDILLIENDIEKINRTIIDSEKTLYLEEQTKLGKKEKRSLKIVQLIIVMSAYGLACLFSPGYQIIVAAYVGWLMIGLNIAFSIISKRYKKYISGIRNGLITAYQIKDELEQRLTDIKDKSKDSIQTNIVVSAKENSSKNDVIVLENPTPFCVEAKRRLEESFAAGYEQGSKSKVKRLTLKYTKFGNR